MSDREAPASRPRRAVRVWRRLLTVLVLAVLGSLGGVAMTSLWPAQVQTDLFQAQVRMLPSPLRTSVVHLPTVFGDIDLDFDGPVPAPGIEARVQVRPEITDRLTRGPVTVRTLAPDPAQLHAAMEDGLVELGWKFVGGVLVTDAVVTGLWLLGRRRRPVRASLEAVVSATVVAALVPALASVATYRAGNYSEFRTTSLLSTVRSSTGLFTDIPGRAQQATPYVQNLLALSDALHQEFVPDDATVAPGARFLLISDVHGMNYYPLVRQIVQDEQITAVIDSGDLINFGQPQEGDVAGIYAGIEALGVPYVYVRGNHDATSRTDETVLKRMAQLPDVILLEPTGGSYVEADINGVRISGFNDWRSFGEEDTDFVALAEDAARAYQDSTAGNPPPDILVSHEPFGLDVLETGQVKVNGHMHKADLVGERIQVGSFSGGGLVNHFQAPQGEDPATAGELVGEPYSFDILSVGPDCVVQTLTRYSYRNLVSGRPQFDTVSVINGAQFALPLPEGSARTCGPDQGVSSVPLSPVPGSTG